MPTTSRGYRYPSTGEGPNGPAQIQALAEDVNTDMSAQYSAVSAPTVASASAPAVGTRIIRKLDYVSATTSAGALVTVTFDSPFPNGILHVSVTMITGTSVAPVVNSGTISKTSVSLLWPSTASTAVTFTYEAVGW